MNIIAHITFRETFVERRREREMLGAFQLYCTTAGQATIWRMFRLEFGHMFSLFLFEYTQRKLAPSERLAAL